MMPAANKSSADKATIQEVLGGLVIPKKFDAFKYCGVVVLNNKKVLRRKISSSARLQSASREQLQNLQLISDGIGALSLKGLLKEEFSLKEAA